MNRPIFAANWKCNLELHQVQEFINWSKTIESSSGHVILFSSACYLSTLAPLSNPSLWIGAQDVSAVQKGAFTGEVAAFQLKSLNVQIVLVGHSERRHVFGENSDMLSTKLERLIESDLPTCFCVGETQEERDQGKTLEVISTQLQPFIEHLKQASSQSAFFLQSMLAYEPVWAIGTGQNATSKDIQEVHHTIRNTLESQNLSHIPILYGGSVKGKNASDVLKTPGVDGVLVGGASNNPKTFDEIRGASL